MNLFRKLFMIVQLRWGPCHSMQVSSYPGSLLIPNPKPQVAQMTAPDKGCCLCCPNACQPFPLPSSLPILSPASLLKPFFPPRMPARSSSSYPPTTIHQINKYKHAYVQRQTQIHKYTHIQIRKCTYTNTNFTLLVCS